MQMRLYHVESMCPGISLFPSRLSFYCRYQIPNLILQSILKTPSDETELYRVVTGRFVSGINAVNHVKLYDLLEY